MILSLLDSAINLVYTHVFCTGLNNEAFWENLFLISGQGVFYWQLLIWHHHLSYSSTPSNRCKYCQQGSHYVFDLHYLFISSLLFVVLCFFLSSSDVVFFPPPSLCIVDMLSYCGKSIPNNTIPPIGMKLIQGSSKAIFNNMDPWIVLQWYLLSLHRNNFIHWVWIKPPEMLLRHWGVPCNH